MGFTISNFIKKIYELDNSENNNFVKWQIMFTKFVSSELSIVFHIFLSSYLRGMLKYSASSDSSWIFKTYLNLSKIEFWVAPKV